ncbi:MAG: thioredoxin [Candidatus Nezhaarchaeales archaeon]
MGEGLELERVKRRMLDKLLKASKGYEVPGKPVHVGDGFDEFVSKYPLVVIDFWAEWCGPCLMLAPIIDELAMKYRGKIVFGKVNVDENPTIARRFSIYVVPTLIVFRKGLPVGRLEGYMPLKTLEAELSKYLD